MKDLYQLTDIHLDPFHDKPLSVCGASEGLRSDGGPLLKISARVVAQLRRQSTLVGDGTVVDRDESASGADAPMLAARIGFNSTPELWYIKTKTAPNVIMRMVTTQ